jgi:hypothetical protein
MDFVWLFSEEKNEDKTRGDLGQDKKKSRASRFFVLRFKFLM